MLTIRSSGLLGMQGHRVGVQARWPSWSKAVDSS